MEYIRNLHSLMCQVWFSQPGRLQFVSGPFNSQLVIHLILKSRWQGGNRAVDQKKNFPWSNLFPLLEPCLWVKESFAIFLRTSILSLSRCMTEYCLFIRIKIGDRKNGKILKTWLKITPGGFHIIFWFSRKLLVWEKCVDKIRPSHEIMAIISR